MRVKPVLLTALLLLLTPVMYPGSRMNDLPDEPAENNPEHNLLELYALLNDTSLDRNAFHLAMLGHKTLTLKGLAPKDSLLTIIDFSKPSSDERFYVINLRTQKMLVKTLVAHGRNSGELFADRFSNRPQSHQSALGFYVTGQTYRGSQGYSMLLNGVDTGFNENARKRSIVIHGADYATHRYVKQYGRLGRSFGCPALPPDDNTAVINLIRDGSVVFGYFPSPDYLGGSCILKGFVNDSLLAALR